MIGTPVRSAADTNPPRPKRCSLYRSRNGLPMPLKPSGHTPTSSPADSSRSASGLQASVAAVLAGELADHRHWNTRSAPSMRRCRWAGWSSCSATEVISASSGTVPEWLATTSAPPSSGHVVQAGGLDPEPRLGTAAGAAGGRRCRSGRGRSRSRRRRSRRSSRRRRNAQRVRQGGLPAGRELAGAGQGRRAFAGRRALPVDRSGPSTGRGRRPAAAFSASVGHPMPGALPRPGRGGRTAGRFVRRSALRAASG